MPVRVASIVDVEANLQALPRLDDRRDERLPPALRGHGKSGNGSRQSGIWVLDQFTRWQSMNLDYAGKLQKAQMDINQIEGDMEFQL